MTRNWMPLRNGMLCLLALVMIVLGSTATDLANAPILTTDTATDYVPVTRKNMALRKMLISNIRKDSVRASWISDTAKRAGWAPFDSANTLRVAHDTGDMLRTMMLGYYNNGTQYARDRIHDSLGPVRTTIAGLQPLDGDLTAIAALSSTGYPKRIGTDNWTMGGLLTSDLTGGRIDSSLIPLVINGNTNGLSAGVAGTVLANRIYASPNGTSGALSPRLMVPADVPTLNQNTTGSAATLTTPRTLTIGATGKTFNGSSDVGWNWTEMGVLPLSAGSSYPLSGDLYIGTQFVRGTGGYAALQYDGTTLFHGSQGTSKAQIFADGGTNVLQWSAGGNPGFGRPLSVAGSITSSTITQMAPLGANTSYAWFGRAGDNSGTYSTTSGFVSDAFGNVDLFAKSGAAATAYVAGVEMLTVSGTGTRIAGALTLPATGPGYLKQVSAGSAVTVAAIPVSDLPASVQTVQGISAGRLPIGNGTSGLTSDANLTWNGTTGLTIASGGVQVIGIADFYSPVVVHDYIGGRVSATDLDVSGIFTPHKIIVTSPTYTLPTVATGEQILILFQADTVAVFSGSAQRVDFRDQNGSLLAIPAGGTRVDVAGSSNGWFGTGTTGFNNSRATSATLIGCNSAHARLVF